MGDPGRGQRRLQLAKMIEEKLHLVDKLRGDLDYKKKHAGNSVDEQISVAELEYRLVKEEMALLTLQEKHWESAALWDVPHTPDIQKEVCEVMHSYVTYVKEKGSVAALHASEHLAAENSVLVSSQTDKPSMPVVEWAHHSTDLQPGDRLLEVNGHLVIGKDSSEVSKILNASHPLCRIVFLRPLTVHQLLKSNGCREISNLRHELTSVVSKLNHKILENSKLKEQNLKIQKECEDLRIQNQKLKLQFLSLQSVLLYLYRTLEKNSYQVVWDNINTVFFSHYPSIYDILRKTSSDFNGTFSSTNILRDILSSKKKSIPWLELSPSNEICTKAQNVSKSQDSASQEISENG